MISRLVQQQDVRQPHQRPREQHAAFHPAGKRRELGRAGQLHFLHQFFHAHVGLPVLLGPSDTQAALHDLMHGAHQVGRHFCGSREMARLDAA